MMADRKKWALLLSAILLGSGIFLGSSKPDPYDHTRYQELKEETTDLSDQAIQRDEDFSVASGSGANTSYKGKTMTVDESFTTHLPLVVLETPEQRPQELHYWDKEQGKYVEFEDVEPYVEGTISLINNEEGYNHPTDSPEKESKMKIRMRGNSSMRYDKHQYLIKLLHEDGSKNKMNLLGMGKESDWILNISLIDKSLMRNKLAYDSASEIMPNVSDSRYCEVIWKENDTYHYEGVYMLVEPVEVSENRVDVMEQAANLPFMPALLRRDRLKDEGVFIQNTASWDNTYYGFLEVLYPKEEDILPGNLEKLNAQIETFEQTLLSENPEEFIKYRDMINMDTFVDYFLINEFFGNYDAGNNSTYIYIDRNGRISMGPVWDYDGAMDNWFQEANYNEAAPMANVPWFSEMVRDPEFIRLLDERFQELRKGVFSDESMAQYCASYLEELGPAADRDYARWGYFYTSENLNPHPDGTSRNIDSHYEEIERLLKNLSDHGDWMENHLRDLVYLSDSSISDPIISNTWSQLMDTDFLPVLFVGVFFISIFLIQRGV